MNKKIATLISSLSIVCISSQALATDSTKVLHQPKNPLKMGYILATGVKKNLFCKNTHCEFNVTVNKLCPAPYRVEAMISPLTNDYAGICATRGYIIEKPKQNLVRYNSTKQGYNIHLEKAYASFVTVGCNDKKMSLEWTLYCMS